MLGTAGALGRLTISHTGSVPPAPDRPAFAHRATSAEQGRHAGPTGHPVAPPLLPVDAAQIAVAYAEASYHRSADDSRADWLSNLAPLVTPTWLARLEAAGLSLPTASAAAQVLAVLPAHAPAPLVAADVVLDGVPGGPTALLVELAPGPSGWQVVRAS